MSFKVNFFLFNLVVTIIVVSLQKNPDATLQRIEQCYAAHKLPTFLLLVVNNVVFNIGWNNAELGGTMMNEIVDNYVERGQHNISNSVFINMATYYSMSVLRKMFYFSNDFRPHCVLTSKRWKRTSSFVMSGPSIPWSNVDYGLADFVKKNPPPQVVKVKKDASKSAALKSSVELILHDSKTLKKVEACIVSEGTTFVLPYDCPAKVYQLTKAEEYSTLGELRKALPTCRFFIVTVKPKDQQLQDIEQGEVLTIVFKKTISGSDVFTCERKKLGVKIEIKSNAEGGFAPMGTTAERKISDFVRQYSTFPVGICLTESTLTNKAFASLKDTLSQSKSGLIRLTRLFTVDTVIGSSLGKKKCVYMIPKDLGLSVTASKALLVGDSEHKEFCRKLHEDVDKTSVEVHLSTVVSFGNAENEVVQWSYGTDCAYDEVVPLAAKTSKVNGELPKRDGGVKDKVRKISSLDSTTDVQNVEKEKTKGKEKTKDKSKEKEQKEKTKDKEKIKEKEKPKDKQKDKKNKEPKPEKVKVEKSKVTTTKQEEPEDPVEDSAGYLVPAELLRAQNEIALENKPGDGKERGSIGLSLGRFMDKVKGKKDGKKSDRQASSVDILNDNGDEPQKRSATMPASSNAKKNEIKSKAKTMSVDELNKDGIYDEIDSPATTSPKEKETKKRDKGFFGTAGKKAGAKLRHKLKKSTEDEDNAKPTSKTSTSSSSSLPPSPRDDEIDDQDMYVTPVDDQLSSSCPKTSICDRELPELPPDESRKQSSTLIPELPYDDDDLYDEINPVAKKSFKIPKDLSKLSTNDISEVLRTINMAEHISRFRNEMIDGEIFKALDDKTLDSLGVTDPLQKLRIKKLLKGWRPKK